MESTTATSEMIGWVSMRPTPRKVSEHTAETTDPATPGSPAAWLIDLLAETDVQNACAGGLHGYVQGNHLVGGLTFWKGDDASQGCKDGFHVGGLKGGVRGDGLGGKGNGHELSG